MLLGAVLAVLVAQAPTTDAVALEAAAFAAVDRESWCEAMHLFAAADQAAPATALLENAAQAAEYGGDLLAAVRFREDIVARLPKTARRSHQMAIASLSSRIRKTGAGATCPALTTTTAAESAPAAVEEAPTVRPDQGPDLLRPGIIAGSAGGVAVVVGVTALGVGVLPWFAHATAVEAINAAEEKRADASALQTDQEQARQDWETIGQPLVAVGAGTAALGVVAVVSGVALIITASTSDGEQ